MALLRGIMESLKKNMQIVAGTGTVCLYIVVVYPHQWGLKRFRRLLQMYRDGEPEPVDEDSKRIIQQVVKTEVARTTDVDNFSSSPSQKRLKQDDVFQAKIFDKILWDPVSEANVELFCAYGQDIVHRGSSFSSYGSIIGLPVHFKYRNIEDVEKEKITLNNAPIDWDSAAGKQLVESLILSEKARRFAIARELFYLHTFHIHIQGGLLCSSLFFAYWIGTSLNAVYRLPSRTRFAFRVVLYGFLTGAALTVYCLASDTYNWYRDKKADRKAAALGQEYAEGGVEFYNKLLQRNMALRALMGPDGKHRYTAYGNDVHFWRSPNIPLTSRRDYLQEVLKNMLSSQSEQSVTSAQPA